MPWLVTTSLKLNNDRIQYATIEQDEAKHIILRIETPSYYLIQWCEEQHTSKLDLYYPLIDGTFIEWGHNHPLADLWRRAQSNRHDEWTFFRADGTRQHMPPLKWEDVYQTTEFSLDFPAQSVWSQESDEKPRIPVSLRLEHRGRPLDPELWLLEEDEQHHLEQLLSMVDEEDLKTLLRDVHGPWFAEALRDLQHEDEEFIVGVSTGFEFLGQLQRSNVGAARHGRRRR